MQFHVISITHDCKWWLVRRWYVLIVLWLYVLLTTVGVVLIVPAVLRAIDGLPGDTVSDFVAFAGFFGGLAGLFTRQIGASGLVTVIVAVAVGLAAGVVHPELLDHLRRPRRAE